MFCQRNAVVATGLLAEGTATGVRWVHLDSEQESDVRQLSREAGLYGPWRFPWLDEYDEFVVAEVRHADNRFIIEARAWASWMVEPAAPSERTVVEPALLSLQLAESIREAWVPIARLVALDGTQARLAIPASAGMNGEATSEKWAPNSLYRIIMPSGEPDRLNYRALKHAFVRLGVRQPCADQYSGELLAISADQRAIEHAVASGRELVLAPVRRRSGPIRIRVCDKSGKRALPDVSIFASMAGYSEAQRDLQGTTTAHRDVVALRNGSAAFWYVTLKSGSIAYQIPILNTGTGEIFEFPITPGDESYVEQDLRNLYDDFVFSLDRTSQWIERGDNLAKAKKFSEAYQVYIQARESLPRVDSLATRLRDVVRHDAGSGTPKESDSRLADEYHRKIERQMAEWTKTANDRIQQSLFAQDAVTRREGAARLVTKARELRDRRDIDGALNTFDAALELLRDDDEASASYREERSSLAQQWQIRGGDSQRQARDFVFGELVDLTPEQVADRMDEIIKHVYCLQTNDDLHSIYKALEALTVLFDRTLEATKDRADKNDEDAARRMHEAAMKINDLQRQLDDWAHGNQER